MSYFGEYISKFFWDFKIRDNVEYNFEIVETLLLTSISCKTNKNQEHFYKPVIIIMTSIIECIFYDFFIRIPGAIREGVPNIEQEDIDLIKNMNIPNKLANFNEICKKYELLGEKNDDIYKKIKLFSNIRNRIHIQNSKGDSPKDENVLWTASLVKSCGTLLKDICLLMCSQYPRPKHIPPKYPISHPMSFPEPWCKI